MREILVHSVLLRRSNVHLRSSDVMTEIKGVKLTNFRQFRDASIEL